MKKKTAWHEIKAFAIELVKKKTTAQQIESAPSGKQFALEIGIFAGLVLCYFLLVLSFLSTWLKTLFDQNKLIYAVVAWALVAVEMIQPLLSVPPLRNEPVQRRQISH